MNQKDPHSQETILKRLLTGAGFSIVNLGLAMAIGLFMRPFLLQNLGIRQVGMWELVASFTGFYGLLDFGIISAVSRYITLSFTKKDDEGCNSFSNIGFFLFSSLGVVAAIIAASIATGMYIVYSKTVEDINVLSIVTLLIGVNFMISFPLRVFSGIITGCLRSDLDQMRGIIFRILGAFMTFSVVFCGSEKLGDHTIIALAIGTIVLTLLNAFYYYYLAKKIFPPLHLSPKAIRRADFKSVFSYSILSSWAQMTNTIRFKLSRIIIAAFLSVEIVALYGIAAQLVEYYQQIMTACTMWLTSWFTRLGAMEDHATIRSHLKFAYKMTIVLANFMAFGLIFWSHDFITRWVGEELRKDGFIAADIHPALICLTISMALAMWHSPTVRILYAQAKQGYFAAINTFDALLNLGLTLLWVQPYGMLGVAAANLVATSISRMILSPLLVIWLMKFTVWEFWGQFLGTLLKSLFCLIIPYFLTQYLSQPSYIHLLLNGCLCAICYFSTVTFLCLNQQERTKIFGLLLKFIRK